MQFVRIPKVYSIDKKMYYLANAQEEVTPHQNSEFRGRADPSTADPSTRFLVSYQVRTKSHVIVGVAVNFCCTNIQAIP